MMRKLCFFILAIGLVVGFSGSVNAVTINLNVSKTSGVAPLAVFFDAVNTTSIITDKPFHHLDYTWDFGDDDSVIWAISGKKKNFAKGAMTAHVFEEAGTYNILLTVKDADGNIDTETVQVVVSDPEVVFAGTKTICFSNDLDFTGCPNDAQQVTTSDFVTAMSNVGTGRRLLFARGDTFTATGRGYINVAGPGLVGAFGGCTSPDGRGICQNAPRILSNHAGDGIGVTSTGDAPDWRITNLEITSLGITGSRGISARGIQNHLLISRMELINFHGGIYNFQDSNNFFVYNSVIRDNAGGQGGNLAYLGGYHLALLGNSMRNSTQVEHVLRLFHIDNSIIINNYFGIQATDKHVVKLHNGLWTYEPGNYAENIILSDNVIENSDISGASWTVGIGTSSSSRDEELREIIVERNHLIQGTGGQVLLNIWSKNTTIRNNIFDVSRGTSNYAISVTRRGPVESPKNVEVHGNTAYGSLSGIDSGVRFLGIGEDARNIIARNNLVTSDNVNEATLFSGTSTFLTESNNLVADTSVFVNLNPVDVEDFILVEGSSPIDTGAAVSVFNDFAGNSIPQNSVWDIGAYEYIQTGPDTVPPILSTPFPTANLSSGTTNTTISLTTSEIANCRYSTTSGVSYSLMLNTFSATDSIAHSELVTGLQDGNNYSYYVKCNDIFGNYNEDDSFVISFGVDLVSTTCGAADLDSDGDITVEEITDYIAQWRLGDVTMGEIMIGIREWKDGC
ncbi:PKD domain-containing protein [archaeon]|nr:PKD domain-containing protein [archaeon]